MPGREYQAQPSRFGFNGHEHAPELNNDSYSAQFWQYDARLARRWNIDPKPIVGTSEYSAFNNNPIIFSDPLGDTTGYYTNKQELIFTTYEKGYNRIMILNDNKVEAMRKYAAENKDKVDNFRNKVNNFYEVDEDFKRLGYGTVYDLHNFESFYDNHQFKGEVYKIGGGILKTAFNIKLNGKSISQEKLIEFVKSTGLGPEYIGSLVMKGGIAQVGDDISNDGDLTKVSTNGRSAHIHNHPPIVLDLTFNYKFGMIGKEQTGYSSTYLPVLNSGMDAHDHSMASPSGLRSVLIDGNKIYLFNGIWDQTIRFNRKTRAYE